MENEIKNLKLEIEVLEKRINCLERKENRRKVLKLIKVILIIGILIFIGLKIYKYYRDIVDFYNQIQTFNATNWFK